MIFTQIQFWIFFTVVLAGLWLIGDGRRKLRNAFLFLASLFFYYKTGGVFLLLLLTVVAVNYLCGIVIGAARRKGVRLAAISAGIIADIVLLSYFKYTYFFADTLNSLLGTSIQVKDLFGAERIILPVGVSFFTFQAISYCIDVYRGKVKAVKNFLDFGFYITFFPQLVAGPIVRATDFLPQLDKGFNLGKRQFGLAVFWILNGLGKKFILSDYLAVNFIDRVFENPSLFTSFENLSALLGYALQIYADFSGYTDIAIGCAMLMGFFLPKNFDSPYKAHNIVEFWRRWHISLSSWLRDYLYIPLGGNRNITVGSVVVFALFATIASLISGSWVLGLVCAAVLAGGWVVARTKPSLKKLMVSNLNRMDTMLIGGLWHGASWNFVLWGALNAVGMFLSQVWERLGRLMRGILPPVLCALLLWAGYRFEAPLVTLLGYLAAVATAASWLSLAFKKVSAPASVIVSFLFICFTWLLFRNADLEDAGIMAGRICAGWNLSQIPQIVLHYWKVFAVMVAGFVIHFLPERFKRRYRLTFACLPLPLMLLAVILSVFVFYQFITADLQSFIYFQF